MNLVKDFTRKTLALVLLSSPLLLSAQALAENTAETAQKGEDSPANVDCAISRSKANGNIFFHDSSLSFAEYGGHHLNSTPFLDPVGQPTLFRGYMPRPELDKT